MRLSNQFSVDAPIAAVWDVLVDVQRVAPCLPGARVLEKLDGERYRAGMTVKLGPMTLNYEGEVELLERDPAARRARLSGSAREARGQGTANAQVAFSLAPHGAGTRADIEMDVQLSGRAAALGQSVLQPVAEKLVTEFASNLAQLCAPRAGAAPAAPRSEALDAAPLLVAVARRFLDVPGIVVAAVLALAFLAWECAR
jgi:carbon monoxide dehydrogenase subunit G